MRTPATAKPARTSATAAILATQAPAVTSAPTATASPGQETMRLRVFQTLSPSEL
jgi:hypothetical protein